jgi:branched-chain amino acid transport system permease protein
MEILPQLLVNALIAGSIYALASSGLSLTYGLLRILNFAHGHLMMVGVYFFYLLSVQMGWNLPESALGTALFSVVLAFVTLKIFVLPFSKYSFILTLVTTLALSNILEALVSIFFGVNVKSLSPGTAAKSIEIGSIYITPIQILIIASALILLSLAAFIIHSTSIGRRIRALSEDSFAAQSLGVNQAKVSFMVYTFGVLFAAYAGILVGYETNMQPTMGTAYTIKAFAAMILGGLGNLWGTILGSYILGLVENLSIGLDFGDFSIPAGYKDAFSFMIILIVLLFRPQGLFSVKKRTA